MKYFLSCKCLEDVKELYKKYVLELHPDKGGNMWDFIAMRKEYEIAFNKLKNIHRTIDEQNNEKFYNSETTEAPEEYANIIDILAQFENIKIELLGKWLWITGDTKPYKEQLKSLGFKWSNKKVAWYNTFGYSSISNKHTKSMSYNDLCEHWQAREIKPQKHKNTMLA